MLIGLQVCQFIQWVGLHQDHVLPLGCKDTPPSQDPNPGLKVCVVLISEVSFVRNDKISGVQSCAMEGREYAGFHTNQSPHQLMSLINTPSTREEGTY